MTNRHLLGLGMMGLAAILIVAGLSGWLGLEAGEPVAAETTTAGATETSTAPTTPRQTTAPTTGGTTATTTVVTTSTTVANATLIELFVPTFAAAVGGQDVDLLMGMLHPAVFSIHDEQTCRTFIAREIAPLEDYHLTGSISGPTSQAIEALTVETFTAPVAFTLQGQEFEATTAFAVENGEVLWVGDCA